MKLISVYFFILVLFGCASQQAYEGEKRSKDEVAIIEPESPSLFKTGPTVSILEVDGKKLDQLKSGAFEVLPGEHTIKVRLFSVPGAYGGIYMKTEPISITFTAKAGETYTVGNKGATYFVKENSTGRIVAEK